MERTIRRSIVSGRLPAIKSPAVAHRAIVAASLAPGQSVVSNVPFTRDVQSTISACNSMGADIVFDSEKGVADIFGMVHEYGGEDISCGQSNSTLKLLLPILPAFAEKSSLSATGHLAKKNLAPYFGYVERLGATIGSNEDSLPVKIMGPLVEHEMVFFPRLGTQFFSGLLFSSSLREEQVSIALDGNFRDETYVGMTMRVLSEFGSSVQRVDELFLFDGAPGLRRANFEAPASAYLSSFVLLAGAAAGKVAVEGLDGEDSQRLEGLFRSFGASASVSGRTLSVSAGLPHKGEFDALQLGAYLPHAIVLAALSQSECGFSNINSLDARQDGRLRLLLRELSQMGMKSEEKSGALTVMGSKLSAADVHPDGDSAVAMACSIAALCASGQTRINDAECVGAVCPGFFNALALLGAIVH